MAYSLIQIHDVIKAYQIWPKVKTLIMKTKVLRQNYEKLLIAETLPPANPYRVDLETVDRIKTSPQNWQSWQWY